MSEKGRWASKGHQEISPPSGDRFTNKSTKVCPEAKKWRGHLPQLEQARGLHARNSPSVEKTASLICHLANLRGESRTSLPCACRSRDGLATTASCQKDRGCDRGATRSVTFMRLLRRERRPLTVNWVGRLHHELGAPWPRRSSRPELKPRPAMRLNDTTERVTDCDRGKWRRLTACPTQSGRAAGIPIKVAARLRQA